MLRAVALALLLPSAAGAVETMRIAMGESPDEVSLSGKGLSFGLDVEDGRFTPAPGDRAVVRQVDGRIEIDGAPWPEASVRLRAGEWAQDAGVPGRSAIRANGFEVRGDVVVRVKGRGLESINVIPLEDYLAAVLGGEMPRSFPLEALKAQAVAARTYALQKKIESLDQPWHLGSSVIHQVYGGLEREDPRTREAVEATRGEVLTWELQPIEAYFHASCGGHTEDGRPALGRDLPYLRSVSCPCGGLPASHWEATIPAEELREALGQPRTGQLEVLRRTRTGRVEMLSSGAKQIDAATFRRKVGYTRIKSLDFEVTAKRNGELHFVGRGYGHGAGLCQWGAKAMADAGQDYRQILAHYYPGTELQQLY
jgi:stage II sporulation protein D